MHLQKRTNKIKKGLTLTANIYYDKCSDSLGVTIFQTDNILSWKKSKICMGKNAICIYLGWFSGLKIIRDCFVLFTTKGNRKYCKKRKKKEHRLELQAFFIAIQCSTDWANWPLDTGHSVCCMSCSNELYLGKITAYFRKKYPNIWCFLP